MAEIDKVVAREGMKSVDALTPWEYRLGKIKTACLNAPDVVDLAWAHGRCQESEDLHEAVWRWETDRSDVQSEVIPALEEALVLMRSAKVEEQHEALLDGYIGNVNARIRNLRDNYLEGLPSAFRPDCQWPPSPDGLGESPQGN